MAKYCLDSNVIIDTLRDDSVVSENFANAILNGDEICISAVAYYEVLRGFKRNNATRKLGNFLKLCQDWAILPFDVAEANKAVEIYAKMYKQQIEDNDVYIAAIAMVNDCTLVTANTRHFSRVEGLQFVNWRDND